MTSTVWEMVHGATIYQCADPTVAVCVCNIKALNTAKFAAVSTTPIAVGEIVTIREKIIGTTTTYHNIIVGEIMKYTRRVQDDPSVSKPAIWDYEITEQAVELDKFRVHTAGGSYTVTVPAVNVDVAINDYVLYGSGWSVDPAHKTTEAMDSLQLTVMTGIGGLNKYANQLAAGKSHKTYYMWFGTPSNPGAKVVGWGEHRSDRTSVNFIKGMYWSYESYVTKNALVDGVIVYGPNMTNVGQYPATFSGHQVAVYQYNDASSAADCTATAAAIYLEYCNDPKARVQFKTNQSLTKIDGEWIQEGDLLKVNGANWLITDITYSVKEVQIGLGICDQGIFTRLGDQLRPLGGSVATQAEQSWDPGPQNLSSDPTVTTKFTMNIPHMAGITTVPMVVKISAYKAYSSQVENPISNKLLSQYTTPNYFVPPEVESLRVAPGYYAYFPRTPDGQIYVKSTPQTDGFQYALATFDCIVVDEHNSNNPNIGGYVYISCEYRYGTGPWIEGTYQQKCYIQPALFNQSDPHLNFASAIRLTSTYVVPGTDKTLEVFARWKVICAESNPSAPGYLIANYSATLDVIPRHTHVISQGTGYTDNTIKPEQVDDAKNVELPPPTQVAYRIISAGGSTSGWMTANNNTPVEIMSYLSDGINTIEFASMYGANQCTISPSAHYKAYE